MSEATFPFKKAIPIISVTWILSFVTTLALIYFAPNIFPSTWHEVTRFEGFDDESCEFEVPSLHWRINWVVWDAFAEDAKFYFYISERQSFDFSELTSDQLPLGIADGEEYITGSGWFQIEVVADSLKWRIIVEAYY